MTAPARKEFKLSHADKGNLLELIRSNDLLVTDVIGLPQHDPTPFFNVSVKLAAGGREGAISISGPRRDAEKIISLFRRPSP